MKFPWAAAAIPFLLVLGQTASAGGFSERVKILSVSRELGLTGEKAILSISQVYPDGFLGRINSGECSSFHIEVDFPFIKYTWRKFSHGTKFIPYDEHKRNISLIEDYVGREISLLFMPGYAYSQPDNCRFFASSVAKLENVAEPTFELIFE